MGAATWVRHARWWRVAAVAAMLAAAVGSQPATALPLPLAGMAWGDACPDKGDRYYSEYCRGRGLLGTGRQLGSPTPVRITLPPGTHLLQVGAGWGFSVGLLDDGRVVSWGLGYRGRLGDGTFKDHNVPAYVPVPTAARVVAVSAGYDHSLALDADGVLWAWGFNRYAQIGDGTRTIAPKPVRVHLPAGVRLRAIEAGTFHSMAITDNGRVLDWGTEKLNESAAFLQREPKEVPLPSDADVVQVEGVRGSLAVTKDGRVFKWGDVCMPNSADHNYGDCRPEPHEIELPTGERIVQAAPGRLLTSKGEVYEAYIQRAGEPPWRRVPLPAGAAVRCFDFGGGHVLAVSRERRVLAWGFNYARQLGVGSTEHSTSTPAYVQGLDNVLAVTAGDTFSLAIRADLSAA
jgi:alpha-tubulin suppressor-like RCC1 family protein